MLAYAIQSLVFEPPLVPGYLEHEATYVRTEGGLRIATMLQQPEARVPLPSGDCHTVDDLIDLAPDEADTHIYTYIYNIYIYNIYIYIYI